MPTIKQSLYNQDLRFLQIVANKWGISLQAPDARQALPQLVKAMLDPQLASEIFNALSASAQQAIRSLMQQNGRLPWTQFTRQFGEVREMGPGRRDREEPHLDPISSAESLWYAGFLARAFFDTPSGPLEHAYIPSDLLKCLQSAQAEILDDPNTKTSDVPSVLGRPASPKERAHISTATDRILDHVCTYLSAKRSGISEAEIDAMALDWDIPLPVLIALVQAMGLVDEALLPDPQATRQHLQASRSQALLAMAQTWLQSESINDLHLIPHLRAEGEWHNDPLKTRNTVIAFIDLVPIDAWWSLRAFVHAIKDVQPDFQRMGGEYDTWYLWDRRDEQFLRGYSHWDEVEGSLIRYLITGPMHWLGLTDIAAPTEEEPPSAFRISKWAKDLRAGSAPASMVRETKKIHVRATGQVSIDPLVPRDIRYQVARFCQWEGEKGGTYRFRITSASLLRAQEQGLTPNQLQILLGSHADEMPPNIFKAIKNWAQRGVEVRLENVSVLRLSSPNLLKRLRDSKAARYLGDPLGPTTVIVKPGRWYQLQSVLTEMGYLSESQIDIGEDDS